MKARTNFEMGLKQLRDNTCPTGKQYYTCHFGTLNYDGCCSVNACQNNGCPDPFTGHDTSALAFLTTETHTDAYTSGAFTTIEIDTETLTITLSSTTQPVPEVVPPVITITSSTSITSTSRTVHPISPSISRGLTTTIPTSMSVSRSATTTPANGYAQSSAEGSTQPSGSGTHNTTIVAGSVAGAVAALLAVLFAILWLRSRRKRRADKVGKALNSDNVKSPTTTASEGDTENAFEKGLKKPVPRTTRASTRFSLISSLTSGTGPKDLSRSHLSAFQTPDEVGSRAGDRSSLEHPDMAGTVQDTTPEMPDTDSHGRRAELSPDPERSLINSPKLSTTSQNRSTSSSEPATPVMSSNLNGLPSDKHVSRNGGRVSHATSFMTFNGDAGPQR